MKYLALIIFNIGILGATDLVLNGAIDKQVDVKTQYNSVTNYATFTNASTSFFLDNGGGY